MNKKIFSIITITFNNYKGLKKTYESLINQSTNNFNWIVIDGNSNDKTKFFLEELLQKHNFLTYISEEDKGIYDAMNKGLRLSNDEYVYFLNAGDVFVNNYTLAKVEEKIIQNNKPDFVYGDSLEESMITSETFYKKSRSYKTIWYGMFTHHQAMFYKNIDKLQYSLDYKIASDYDYTIKFLKQTVSKVYINEAICIFEKGGISSTQDALGEAEQWKIRKNEMGYSYITLFSIKTIHKILKFIKNNIYPLYVKIRY